MSESVFSVLHILCRDLVGPNAAAVDKNAAFPSEALAALGNAGLLGAVSSRESGGLQLGPAGAARIVQALAEHCPSTAMVVTMHYCGTAVLEAFADPQTRRDAASGRHLSTLAFSEAGSRSQFWAPVGSAVADGDDVVLTARKTFVTSAHFATAYVWSSRPVGDAGVSSLWLVPNGTAGLRTNGAFDGLGLRGNDSAPVVADGVRVPLSARLGEHGKGFDVMMGVVLPLFNLLSASVSVGILKAAVAATATHATSTRFAHTDSSLADLGTIRNTLARMKIAGDCAQLLVDDTVAAMLTQRPDTMLRVLQCKAAAGEAATEVLDQAMRVCGGAAFAKGSPVERLFRDARAATVMGPTTDVLYDFIGKAVCGLPLF